MTTKEALTMRSLFLPIGLIAVRIRRALPSAIAVCCKASSCYFISE